MLNTLERRKNMKFLNNLSMAKKLIIFTIIAVAGLCIVGYIGISSLMQTTDTLNDMYDYNLQIGRAHV
jgi:hypothetical protein